MGYGEEAGGLVMYFGVKVEEDESRLCRIHVVSCTSSFLVIQ